MTYENNDAIVHEEHSCEPEIFRVTSLLNPNIDWQTIQKHGRNSEGVITDTTNYIEHPAVLLEV